MITVNVGVKGIPNHIKCCENCVYCEKMIHHYLHLGNKRDEERYGDASPIAAPVIISCQEYKNYNPDKYYSSKNDLESNSRLGVSFRFGSQYKKFFFVYNYSPDNCDLTPTPGFPNGSFTGRIACSRFKNKKHSIPQLF